MRVYRIQADVDGSPEWGFDLTPALGMGPFHRLRFSSFEEMAAMMGDVLEFPPAFIEEIKMAVNARAQFVHAQEFADITIERYFRYCEERKALSLTA